MSYQNDDVRIHTIRELLPPSTLLEKFPASQQAAQTVLRSRQAIHRILNGEDDRLLVVIGPCSIHDVSAAREYGERLRVMREKLQTTLEITMRTYFEKPRTTIGWKGLINDPHMNGSFDINHGLALGRQLLVELNAQGLPTAGEFLDMITPQYLGDLMSWGAIGARTTESQVHRELASGLSCPVGFKNGSDGNVKIAIDAVAAARNRHCFLSVTKSGHSAIVETCGNEDTHLILRGGKTPNYAQADIEAAKQALAQAQLPIQLMVDFSHANSQKQYQRQLVVAQDVARQIAQGEAAITGVMLESNLVEGNQSAEQAGQLVYGQSVTDGCIGWQDSEKVLLQLAEAVEARRTLARRG